MKTIFAKNTTVQKKWHLIDAEDKVLGRLACRVASILRGKDKPIFTPNVDCGDFVVIINAGKVRLTGAKLENKVYRHHSGYPGGLKTRTAKNLMQTAPEEIITMAVGGMLPKSRLGKAQLKKLKVYKGADHPHQAQTPEVKGI
ncbi:MAG: 50S ribosomal protein L13 [Nitrospirae bacterium]|nr:50S ribosomal protein L13 [Nitrospirota bacterium]